LITRTPIPSPPSAAQTPAKHPVKRPSSDKHPPPGYSSKKKAKQQQKAPSGKKSPPSTSATFPLSFSSQALPTRGNPSLNLSMDKDNPSVANAAQASASIHGNVMLPSSFRNQVPVVQHSNRQDNFAFPFDYRNLISQFQGASSTPTVAGLAQRNTIDRLGSLHGGVAPIMPMGQSPHQAPGGTSAHSTSDALKNNILLRQSEQKGGVNQTNPAGPSSWPFMAQSGDTSSVHGVTTPMPQNSETTSKQQECSITADGNEGRHAWVRHHEKSLTEFASQIAFAAQLVEDTAPRSSTPNREDLPTPEARGASSGDDDSPGTAIANEIISTFVKDDSSSNMDDRMHHHGSG